jgi:hypothetical protein
MNQPMFPLTQRFPEGLSSQKTAGRGRQIRDPAAWLWRGKRAFVPGLSGTTPGIREKMRQPFIGFLE